MTGTDPTRSERRRVYSRDGDRCVKCGRWAPGHDIHHRLLRSRGGDNRASNLITLCRTCHGWVHSMPLASSAAGLMLIAAVDPSGATVETWRGEVRLHDDFTATLVTPRDPGMGVLRGSQPD